MARMSSPSSGQANCLANVSKLFESSTAGYNSVLYPVPDLMVKLLKAVQAVEEKTFTELVLNKQTKVLIEEWKK